MQDCVVHGEVQRSLRLPLLLNAGGTFELAKSPPVELKTVTCGVVVIGWSGTSL
jgi:hypothetical protein